jgi:hypothetical protein
MARTRSRKRRPAGARQAPREQRTVAQGGSSEGGGSDPGSPTKRGRAGGEAKPKAGGGERPSKQARDRSGAGRRGSPMAPTYGERPRSPWHPLPLSELLILTGVAGFVLGLRRKEVTSGGLLLLASIAAMAIGTFEVTLREHRSGYRSHTVMLALLPVLVFHSLVVLGVSLFTTAPRLLNVGLFAIDIALFALLFRLLRARFLDARHARVLRER